MDQPTIHQMNPGNSPDEGVEGAASPKLLIESASTGLPIPDTIDFTENSPAPPSDLRATFSGMQLGRYSLRNLVGQGGFAQVWRAFDRQLEREVAVKVARPDRSIDENCLLEEARKVAQLRSSGIVPIYDVGHDGQRFFIVSEFINGKNLAEWIAANRPTFMQSAGLISEVASNLHQAHLRGFVHRDVKPSNILMDAGGNPFITDFGLAVTEIEQLSRGPSVSGTVRYMSPEQARGDSHLADARSDVYGLGVVFYELLTGRLPFLADNKDDYLAQTMMREPRPPRTVNDQIPLELERICLKCLQKKPVDRYTTALDLAHDLRNWLAAQSRTTAYWPRNARKCAVLGVCAAIAIATYFGLVSPKHDNATGTETAADVRVSQPPPKVEIWPGHAAARYSWDGESLWVDIKTGDDLGLLSFAKLDRQGGVIEVEFETEDWTYGMKGVFLGLVQNRLADTAKFQAFFVTRRDGDYYIHRNLVTGTHVSRQRFGQMSWAPARVSGLGIQALTLRIQVGPGGIEDCTLNGIPLPELVDLNEKFQPADYLGPCGVIAVNSKVLFRSLSFQNHE